MSDAENPQVGSHLPVLIHLLARTRGPVLELGCGRFSTPFLHWACAAQERPLVTVENDPEWFAYAKGFETAGHQVICEPDLDAVDLSRVWTVALVDHAPYERRHLDILRLTHAEYVVAHDAENRHDRVYQYSRCHRAFRYRTKYTRAGEPLTAIFSNVHDVRSLVL